MIFKMEELSGMIIKSGRFNDAISPFFNELEAASFHGVITSYEKTQLQISFCQLLLNPDAAKADELGKNMIMLMMRVPGKLEVVSEKEFKKNAKDSREII